jgi:fructokinase
MIYAIGEVVYDILIKEGQAQKANAGGSMLNASVSLGRMGIPVSFIGETGTDKTASVITTFMESNGVSSRYVEQYAGRNTTIALAFLDHNNDAEYVFHRDYPPQRLTGQLPEAGRGDVVLFGSSFALSGAVRHALVGMLTRAKNNGALVMYDPNFRKPRVSMSEILPMIEENISFSDVVRGSDEDFSAILGTSSLEAIYAFTSKHGCKNLVVTRNKHGVDLKTTQVELHVAAKKIAPVSTIGAGDNFNAGLIYGFHERGIDKQGLSSIEANAWARLLELGISFASHVCESMENYVSKDFRIAIPR